MVGATEEQLTREKDSLRNRDRPLCGAGQRADAGRRSGISEADFRPFILKLIGVHIIGDRAAEIVHIGQAVLALGGTIEYFRDTVFNYPTLAEAFKVAALDGLNKL